MEHPDIPPEQRPHGWQYVAGTVFILFLAFLAWLIRG